MGGETLILSQVIYFFVFLFSGASTAMPWSTEGAQVCGEEFTRRTHSLHQSERGG